MSQNINQIIVPCCYYCFFSDRYDIRPMINNEHDDPELCDICKTVDDGNGPRPSIDDVIILIGTYCEMNVFISLLTDSLKWHVLC